MEDNNILTHSRKSCAQTCLRKHYLAYELGLRPQRDAAALRMGSAVHAGLDLMARGATIDELVALVDNTYADVPAWATPREWQVEGQKVRSLLIGYLWRWSDVGGEIVASELTFTLPIENPDTNGVSKVFVLGGAIDKIVKLPDGRLAVIEHKTTSDDLSPDSDYWSRLRIDHQISLYLHAARRLGYDCQTVLYDVIKKPGIAPYAATPADKRKYAKTGELYANQRDQDESPAEYGQRLDTDIQARPKYYYARREIPRLENEMIEFEHELWQAQQMLRECRRAGRWFRNPNACLQFGRCAYSEICFQGLLPTGPDAETWVPEGFEKLEFVHPELQKGKEHNGTTIKCAFVATE